MSLCEKDRKAAISKVARFAGAEFRTGMPSTRPAGCGSAGGRSDSDGTAFRECIAAASTFMFILYIDYRSSACQFLMAFDSIAPVSTRPAIRSCTQKRSSACQLLVALDSIAPVTARTVAFAQKKRTDLFQPFIPALSPASLPPFFSNFGDPCK